MNECYQFCLNESESCLFTSANLDWKSTYARLGDRLRFTVQSPGVFGYNPMAID